jgi:hypothetical protein
MSAIKWTDDLGVEYDTYQEYVNSPNHNLDIIYNYLARGKRIPQNEEEKVWQEECKRLIAKGGYDISFD